MNIFPNKKIKEQKGFTVVETLVALFIFSTSIVFLISVSATGVSDTNFSKNRLTASYLAEEGLELTRELRDSTVLSNTSGGGWDAFLSLTNACGVDEDGAGLGCNLDPKTLEVCQCTGTTCTVPFTKASSYTYYGYGASCSLPAGQILSPYTRKITIKALNATDSNGGAEVTSTVTWMQGVTLRTVRYQTIIFDWEPHHGSGGADNGGIIDNGGILDNGGAGNGL